MTATRSIRAAFKGQLRDVLAVRPELEQIQVVVGHPGDRLEKTSVIIGRTTGTVSIPVFNAGRKYRDDKFTVMVWFQTENTGADTTEAEALVDELCWELEDALADDPSLGSLPGIVEIELGTVDGPESGLTGTGVFAYKTAEVHVHARYS